LHADLREAGIRGDVASRVLAQFARRQLDMTKAVELATIAQGAAIIAGEDSSETLDALIEGIVKQNRLILGTRGIMVDTEVAFKEYAATIGKTRDQLSELEQTQAFLNAVLKDGASLLELYDLAQNTARKQTASLQREIVDLKAALGAPFEDALLVVVKALRGVVQQFTEATEASGYFRDFILDLGVALSIMGDWIAKAIEWLGDFTFKVITGWGFLTGQARKHGFALIEQYAIGMIDAIQTVLIAAINALTRMLTSWLAPGSAPKVAPKILQWGARTFEEYLRGFADADFGTLNKLQTNISSALANLVSMEKIDKEQSQKIFLGLNEAFAEAMAEMRRTGVVQEGIFQRLASQLGPFGDQIALVTRLQVEQAIAVDRVAQAEKDLADAQARRLVASSKLNSLVERHNLLLRSGATQAQLKASLAQIDAAEQNLSLTDQQIAAAEQAKIAAEEEAKTREEAVKTQQNILDELLQLQKESIVAPEVSAAAAGAAGLEGVEGLGSTLGEGIMTGLATAIEERKAEILAKWEEMKQNIIAKWEEMKRNVGEALLGLRAEWDAFVLRLKEKWNDFKAFWAEVWNAAKTNVLNMLAELETRWNNFKIALSVIVDRIKEKWGEIVTEIKTKVKDAIDDFKGWVEDLKKAWDTVVSTVNTLISIVRILAGVFNSVVIPDWLQWHSPPPLAEAFAVISENIKKLATMHIPQLQSSLDRMRLPVGSAGAGTTNIYNTNNFSPNLNANYAQTRSPATLRDDLIYLSNLRGA